MRENNSEMSYRFPSESFSAPSDFHHSLYILLIDMDDT